MVETAAVSLWLAVALAAVAAVSARHRHEVAVVCVTAAAAALAMATAVLGRALWRLDLSLTYVADHARAGTAAPYRLAGLWGGASGSLLLFAAMTAAVVAVVAWRASPPVAKVAVRFGSVSVAVLAFAVAGTASPFRRLAIPAIDGGGLQPILEHPAMLYHPPLLYLGQVSTLVACLVAIAPTPGVDRRALRRALAASLVLLTAGLATGANWAYVELGWGGYWGWDPVENGVLVPWLLVVGALHLVGQPRFDRAIRTFSAAPWVGVLVATTVARAGIGGSVHAFADDERVALVLLGLVVATMGVIGRSIATNRDRAARRWHVLRLANAGLALLAATVVLAGVLYPIPAPGEPLITGVYYAPLLAPLALVALAGAAVAIVGAGRPTATVTAVLGGCVVVGGVTATLMGARTPFALAVSAAVSLTLGAIVVGGRARSPATLLGHVGFAVLLVGVAGSTQATHAVLSISPGELVEIGGHGFRSGGVTVVDGPAANSTAVQASIEVEAAGRELVTLQPSLVSFPDRRLLLAESALRSRVLRDIQVVLRNANDDGSALLEVSITPLVQFVWFGAALITLGAGATATGRVRSLRSTPFAGAVEQRRDR